MKINEKAVQNVLLVIILLTMGFVLGLMVSSLQGADAADMADISKPSLQRAAVMPFDTVWDEYEPVTRMLKPRHNDMADICELPCTEEELDILAKTVWGEARGCSEYEQGLVIWCILNRLDMGYYGDSIKAVATAPCQFFGYQKDFPIDGDIRAMCEEIVLDWANGGQNRTLPAQYVNFRGDGQHNHFFDRNGVHFN